MHPMPIGTKRRTITVSPCDDRDRNLHHLLQLRAEAGAEAEAEAEAEAAVVAAVHIADDDTETVEEEAQAEAEVGSGDINEEVEAEVEAEIEAEVEAEVETEVRTGMQVDLTDAIEAGAVIVVQPEAFDNQSASKDWNVTTIVIMKDRPSDELGLILRRITLQSIPSPSYPKIASLKS